MCSLTVYLNGERRGVMVKRGLKGPLRWAVDVASASVRIDGPKPPPADYAEPAKLAFTHHHSEAKLTEDGTQH